MKNLIMTLSLVALSTQSAQGAGWLEETFKRSGNALLDVATVGGFGRERQETWLGKEAQIAAIRHQAEIAKQDAEIKKLEEHIKFAGETKSAFQEIMARSVLFYNSLVRMNVIFAKQLSGEIKIEKRIAVTKTSARELTEDLALLTYVLKNIGIPEKQPNIMKLLEDVAKSRSLQIEDFVTRVLEQSQTNRKNLTQVHGLITGLLPQLKADGQRQAEQIRKVDESITINQNSLNAIVKAKQDAIVSANAAAAAATEAARARAAQEASDARAERETRRFWKIPS